MKRSVTYKQCIRWIADNDDQSELLSDRLNPLVTESMVSHLFDVPEEIVRQEVVIEINKRLNAEKRNADRVDGFDRDDLGESADY